MDLCTRKRNIIDKKITRFAIEKQIAIKMNTKDSHSKNQEVKKEAFRIVFIMAANSTYLNQTETQWFDIVDYLNFYWDAWERCVIGDEFQSLKDAWTSGTERAETSISENPDCYWVYFQ